MREVRATVEQAERGLLSCSVMSSDDPRQVSAVLQNRRRQYASGVGVDRAERIPANLKPAAKLLTNSTLRGL